MDHTATVWIRVQVEIGVGIGEIRWFIQAEA